MLKTIDALIERLSESGVPFTRDMWVDEGNEMADQDYGIVEISGPPVPLWGDGELVCQTIQGNVILYVLGGEETRVKQIQDILRDEGISFSLADMDYVQSENKNRWTWRFEMETYLLEDDDA